MMMERAVSFGPNATLAGILTEPDAGSAKPSAPAVLMWNVGVNHRVGPFRIYVDLARGLAERGFVALRFDACGLGDSERREGVSDHECKQLDVREAMDLVSRRCGIQQFVLVGFCSSVDAAHAVALADPRVVGVVHLEGHAYRTRGFRLRFPLRLLSRVRWQRYVKVRLARSRPGELRETPDGTARYNSHRRGSPPPDQFTRDLEAMAARGARFLFVYVGGDTDYNHAEQFWEMFPGWGLRKKIEVEFYPDADHTFFAVELRRRVIERVSRFVHDRFGVGRPATPIVHGEGA
jgi:dienelactone hydrolase